MTSRDRDDALLSAAGVLAPLDLCIIGPNDSTRRTARVAAPYAVVGSDPRCDIHLDDPRVGSRHAFLQVLGGRLLAVDLGCAEGIHLGFRRVASGWVDPGAFLRVGPFHIRCRFPAASPPQGFPPEDPIRDRPADPSPYPLLSADVLEAGSFKSEWNPGRCLALIGRSPDARLRLHHPTVSKHHCFLVSLPAGVWAIDLVSREGLRINGTEARHGPIREGDKLEVGCFRLEFRPASSRPRGTLLVPVPIQYGQELVSTRELALPSSAAPTVPDSAANALVPILQHFGQLQQNMADQFQQALMLVLQVVQKMHDDQAGLIRQEMDQLREVQLELHEMKLTQQALANGTPPSPQGHRNGHKAKPVSSTPLPSTRPATPTSGTPVADMDFHGTLASRIASLEERRQGLWTRILKGITGG